MKHIRNVGKNEASPPRYAGDFFGIVEHIIGIQNGCYLCAFTIGSQLWHCRPTKRLEILTGKITPRSAEGTPSQPTISVVIPAYNAARHIAATLRSVCEQDFQPLEIIVVDDGSTDDIASVARGISPLVRYHRQENAGVAAARNTGIHLATGSHVAFLDADDHWLPFHLANIQAAFSVLPVRWCATAYSIRFDGNPSQDVVLTLVGADSETPILLEDYFSACAQVWRVWTSACVIERSLLLEQGCFDPQLHIGEDIDLWFRIALTEPSLGYCPRSSAIYQQVEDSLMHRNLEAGQGFYNGLCSMKNQAQAIGPGALKRARPLLARHANSAARVAGRTSDRMVALHLLREYGSLLKPTIWLRLALSFLLPSRLNHSIWTLRS